MNPTLQDLEEKTKQFRETEIAYWLNEGLFSLGWWVLVITTIGLFIVWINIVDKKRIVEIVTYGAIVSTIGMFGDIIGLSLLWWIYPISVLNTPPLLEIHNVQMPIYYMIIYQYFPRWKSFFIAAAVNALVFGFVFEPILEWLGIYKQYTWKHIYSIIPYFVIAVVLKWFINKLKKLDRHYP
uniref:Uncharacterized protein n=1 Tax=Virgibacillus oceani TaxID=1479511 RepID=A0A917HH67_9BACI|nr:hypothetical protein GCM10011398_24720 [Virgibacillus oceani]